MSNEIEDPMSGVTDEGMNLDAPTGSSQDGDQAPMASEPTDAFDEKPAEDSTTSGDAKAATDTEGIAEAGGAGADGNDDGKLILPDFDDGYGTRREVKPIMVPTVVTSSVSPSIQQHQTTNSNPLATLAAEAVKAHPAPTDENDPNSLVSPSETPKMSGGMWHSVGIFSGSSCKVTGYTTQDLSEELRSAHFDITKLPASAIDETAVQKLEPGEFYRFRVRAFNSCGFGAWSEVTTFRTTVPGFPSPPSGVKITSTKEGVHLSWQAPSEHSTDILEYSVYLAVRGSHTTDGQNYVASTANQMAFKRVYIGAAGSCLVPSSVLTDAQVTTSTNTPAGTATKPAILFRIAARNKKGYGPSIQVRWIQGEQTGQAPGTQPVRRPGEEQEAGSPKKKRKD